MSEPIVARIAGFAALTGTLTLLGLQAQAQGFVTESACPDNAPVVFHPCALQAAQSFEPPRTLEGYPDLAGAWILPGGQGRGALEDLEEHPHTLDDLGGPQAIIDPPDGLVPIQAWADERRREHPQRYFHHNAACMLAGVPNTMYHGGARQILQTADHLAILTYNVHGYRIVALDGRSVPGEDIHLWNGISNGHWEGNTLVIETTNQSAMSWLDQRGRFYTEDIHVVERLTLVDANTLHYEVTVEDPNVFTRPFTMAFPYRRSTAEHYEIEELACRENNEALMGISRAAGFSVFPGVSPEEARAAREAAQ